MIKWVGERVKGHIYTKATTNDRIEINFAPFFPKKKKKKLRRISFVNEERTQPRQKMKVMVFCECKLTSLESQTQNTHLKDRAELIFKRRRDLKNTKRVQKILIVISICDAEKRREMNAKQNTHSRYNRTAEYATS